MKEIVGVLAKAGMICKRLERVEPRELGTRKRIGIYYGVTTDDYYCLIFVLRKKSRILRKEAEELMELHRRMEVEEEVKIKRVSLLYHAPICSKAATLLREKGWKVLPLEA